MSRRGRGYGLPFFKVGGPPERDTDNAMVKSFFELTWFALKRDVQNIHYSLRNIVCMRGTSRATLDRALMWHGRQATKGRITTRSRNRMVQRDRQTVTVG